MRILKKNIGVGIYFLPKNNGKFRFKTRDTNFEFGKSFATTSNQYNNKVYLEWQIGYDATIIDVKKEAKITSLINYSFKGANKKEKYLYELSEIIYFLYKDGIISPNLIKELFNEISHYNDFISDRAIIINKDLKDVKINNFDFKETITSLPTFFYYPKIDGTQIEISIQKQQYATGIQPMVYYSIPIDSFVNGKSLTGKTFKDLEKGFELEYIIDKNNISNFIDLIKIFGMCSPAHNFDILEILNLILKYK